MSAALLHHLRRRALPSATLRHRRTFIDARIKWIRDRALDHAVEKEKNLRPFLSLKYLLFSSSPSSPSLPLPSINARSSSLGLPFRTIRFIRLFPHAFSEQLPSPPSAPVPTIHASQTLISLHEEEMQAVSLSRDDLADRLLKLLMLSANRRLPLSLIDRLRWDLGLPRDFVKSLLPDYPDYFKISPNQFNRRELDLELVCYRTDLAVSAMERRALETGNYKIGSPLAFPLNFSRGFDLEKKVQKWVDQWQKLPYISPYEDGSHLPHKSDISEKWVVAVLHETLNLFIAKKTEKENLVLLGEKLGLPPGFRRVIVNHPGIFYTSHKLRTDTVVLREGYKRDLLVEKHPIMGVRFRYIHLMHLGKENGTKKDREKGKHKGKGKSEKVGPTDREGEIEDFDDDYDEYEELEEDDDDEEEEEEESADEDLGVDYSKVGKSGPRREVETEM